MRVSDDFKTARTSIAKIHQDIEAINRAAKPSYPSVIEQIDRAMEQLRRQHLEVSRGLEESGEAARMKDIIGANQHWQDMLRQATATRRIAESFAATHQSWLERIRSIQHDSSQFSQLQASVKLALCDASLQLTAAVPLMVDMDFEAIRSRFQIEMPVISELENSIANADASYRSLAESMRDISDITRLPAFVLPGATREIYTTSFALETLRPWDEREEEETETKIQLVAEAELETSGYIALLNQVDPKLAMPYIGARDALYGDNPDRVRHFLSSLRELWNHLLRRVAPDEDVARWISGNTNQMDLLHQGKPTRRARILYVCRELNNEPLTKFLIDDTQALVRLIDLFNRVHELETELTDQQLRAILLKNDSWLMYLLQIWSQPPKK